MDFDRITAHAELEDLIQRLEEVRGLLRAQFGVIVRAAGGSGHHVVLAATGAEGVQVPIDGEPVRIAPDLEARGSSQSLRNVAITSDVRGLVLLAPTAIVVRLGSGPSSEAVIFGTSADTREAPAEAGLSQRDVVALRDAVRLREATEALARERNLTDALQRVFDRQTSVMGLSEVVDVLLASVRQMIGSDVSYFAMPETPGSDIFTFSNFINIETVPFRMLRMPHGRGLGGLARDEEMTVRSMNYADDHRLMDAPVDETLGEGLLSAMSSPIITGNGIAGLVYVANRHFTPFTDDDVALLERFSLAASAVIDEHLGSDYRLEVIRQREREQLALNLHDTVIRSLVELGIHVDEARDDGVGERGREHLDQAGRAANEALTLLRDHLAGLVERPFEDGAMKLREVLVALNRRPVSGRCRREISLKGAGTELEIPAAVAQALIRVGQEALSNADVHAGCDHEIVDIEIRDAEILLRVVDNGRFPDFDRIVNAPSARGHLGLQAMRALVERADGTLEMRHEPGRGTTVEARMPLPWRPLDPSRGGL